MSLSILEISKKLNGKLENIQNSSLVLTGCASLENAKNTDISYFETKSFARQNVKELNENLKKTNAGLILLDNLVEGISKPFLIVENPKKSFQEILSFLYPKSQKTGISKIAIIDSSVEFENKDSVFIGDYVVIKSGVKIGSNIEIDSFVSIGENCKIGKNTIIASHTSIESSTVGDNCLISSGVRIGSQGFGYASSKEGHKHIKHIGKVIIGNNVDIGANSCIDRGMLDNTVIEDGSKLDDLIMVGHGCKIGKNCMIAGQAGLAGGTILEDFVFSGGQVAFGGHLKVEAGTLVAGQSGVISDLKKGVYMGFPAEPKMQFLRKQIALKKLIK